VKFTDTIGWRFHFRDDKKVAKAIREGKTDLITGTGWGFFDKFFSFLWVIGFFKVVERINGEGYQRKMLGIVKLLNTYAIKVLLGIGSMNSVPSLLFKEIGLLKLIGFTATEIKEGICKRGKGKSRPIHKNTLADFLDRLTKEEVQYVLNEVVKLLSRHRFIKGDIFILDATDLETTPKCKGCGRKRIKEKRWDARKRKMVEIETYKYGFKLIMIQEVKSRVVVAATVVKIQEHESKYTLQLLKQAKKNLGGGKIKLLLIDNAFMDGVTLWKIKHKLKIDFITRARTNMDVSKDARSFRNWQEGIKREVKRTKKGKIAVYGVESLLSYAQYGTEEHKKKKYKKDEWGNPLNAVVVTCWKGEEYGKGKEPVFITSLPVDKPLQIIDKYGLRFLIENIGFRELKQGWKIGQVVMKTESAMRSHTLLTLILYSLNACFQTKRGQSLADKGIRRIRREDYSTIHKVIVFAGDYFAILDVEEYSLIARSPPRFFMRIEPDEAKRRLGLKD